LDPAVLSVVQATVKQALLSLGFSSVFGFALGMLCHDRRSIRVLLAFPIAVPGVVAAAAWVAVLGQHGFVHRLLGEAFLLYSLKAVVIAHVFFNAPWIALRLIEARSGFPKPQAEAARTLGASRFQVFTRVEWPFLRPAFTQALAQVWLWCVMSFSLILILGGGPPVDTLETAIYSRIRYGSLNMNGALGCALWQILLTALPAFWLMRQKKNRLESIVSRAPRSASRVQRAFEAFAILIFISPYFLMIHSKLFSGLHRDFVLEALGAWSHSLLISLGVSFLVFILSVGAWVGVRRGRSAFLLPGGLSTLVLSLALWRVYGGFIDFFSGSVFALIAVQAVLFLPWLVRIGFSLQQTQPQKELEAARSLGAKPLRAFLQVDLWRWKGPVLLTLLGVFTASLGETAAVSFFQGSGVQTVPLFMMRLMSGYRFDEAEVVAVSLLLFSAVLFSISGLFLTNSREVHRC